MRIWMIFRHAPKVQIHRTFMKFTTFNAVMDNTSIDTCRQYQPFQQNKHFSFVTFLRVCTCKLHQNHPFETLQDLCQSRSFSSSVIFCKKSVTDSTESTCVDHTTGNVNSESSSSSSNPTNDENSSNKSQVVQIFDKNDLFLGQMLLEKAEILAKDRQETLIPLGGQTEDGYAAYKLSPISSEEAYKLRKAAKLLKDKKPKKEKMFKINQKIDHYDLEIKINKMKLALEEGKTVRAQVKFEKKDPLRTKQSAIMVMKKLNENLQAVGKPSRAIAKVLAEKSELVENSKNSIEIEFTPKKNE